MSLNLNYWSEKDYDNYINYLKSLSNNKLKDFSSKLIFTKYKILGIKIPILRNIAKEIVKGNYKEFLNYTNSDFFEEVMIKGFVIAYSNSQDILDKYLYEYIDKIDNWSLCDSFCNSIKIVRNKDKYFEVFKKLTKNNNEYYVRVGLIAILSHFVNEKNINDIFKILDNINLDKYYVNMASAWLLCECFIKFRDKTIKYLKVSKLNDWSYNKGIQKCIESYRVTKEDKDFLRSIKRIFK